jgi:hypothetical protein
VRTAVLLARKTLALPASTGSKVMVLFTSMYCTTPWQLEGPRRRRRRGNNAPRTGRDMIMMFVVLSSSIEGENL